jgi:RNA polymerase sigma-70 factor (ECF subfamily)
MRAFLSFKAQSGSDEVLLKRAVGGDLQSLERLLQLHREPLRRWLSGQFDLPADDIEDAVQECFFQITRSIRTLEIRSSFRTFLYSVARNRCLDVRRRQSSRNETSLEQQEESDGFELPSPDGESRWIQRIDLERALQSLPPYERLLLKLYFMDELSFTEIAPLVGKSISQVTRDLRKPLAKMKQFLDESHAKSGVLQTPL